MIGRLKLYPNNKMTIVVTFYVFSGACAQFYMVEIKIDVSKLTFLQCILLIW